MIVLKRDKSKQEFDKEKIKQAIIGANNDTPEDEQIYSGDIDELVDEVVSELTSGLYGGASHEINKNWAIDIEEIQDTVELVLQRNSYYGVAKRYIIYRVEHQKLREKRDEITKRMLNVINCDDVQNSNANVDEYSFGGRKFESAGVALKDLALNEFISEDVAKAHKENRIYIHDLDSYAVGMHNCAARETKFLTDKGVYSFEDFNDGDNVVVLTHTGEFKNATVKCFGKQLLNKITFARSGKRFITERFTSNHRWLMEDGIETDNLEVGDRLLKAPMIRNFDFNSASNNEKYYWCLGFVLADGTEAYRWSHGVKNEDVKFVRLRLCGDKVKYNSRFDVIKHSTALLENGDLYLTFSSVVGFRKQFPCLTTMSWKEKLALFDGIYCADGQQSGTRKSILTTNEQLASFIEDVCPSLGYYIVDIINRTGEETNYGKRNFTKEYVFIGDANKYYWTVVDIQPDSIEDVWCLEVEDNHSFVLPNGIVTGNCLFIDFKKLLTEGFTTRNGDVRPPKSISTAMQQVAVIFQCQSQVEFGGCANAHIDFDLAPFVAMSFKKHYTDGLKYIGGWETVPKWDSIEEYLGFKVKINRCKCMEYNYDVYKYALEMTERECKQAAQGLYHNLNTLESRAGSQLPFTSINFGRDTSPEGRMVTKSLLEASIDGIGKYHRTSIFPISIFQHKKGVNAKEGDPNYDLKKLAIKSLCHRIYPNWVNCDFTENIEEENNPDTYNCTIKNLWHSIVICYEKLI